MIADLANFGVSVVRENAGLLVAVAFAAVFFLCYVFSTIRYCSPCNRRRGRFRKLCPECGTRMQTVYRKCS